MEEFLAEREIILARISPDILPLISHSRDFLRGGKRLRALFVYRGWDAVGSAPVAPDSRLGRAQDRIAASLEIFHAAALIHDDIIDHSATRRGAPSMHRRFEAMHGTLGWAGDAEPFGVSAAIILGDLLLGWSDELLDSGLRDLDDPVRAHRVRMDFAVMRTEVTAGQYLDIAEESSWPLHDDADRRDRALTVLTHKSARYSVEFPLVLGALAGGATERTVQTLRAFGLPIGVAFQLRDDVLGVFGDAERTGKPSGDDLREGKRTVLIALTLAGLAPDERVAFEAALGRADLSENDVADLQSTIRRSGGLDGVETMIEHERSAGVSALDSGDVAERAREGLLALANAASRRDA